MFLYFVLHVFLSSILFNEKIIFAESCSIASAITKPGKTTLFDKSANGFCKEWIVGSIAKSQKILIAFNNVKIDCNKNDVLTVYNSDRLYMLYDHCMNRINNTGNFVIAKSKYLIVKLKTTSPSLLSATFDLVFLNTTLNGISSKLTTSKLFTPKKEKSTPSLITQNDVCPSNPKEINDIYGSIQFPSLRRFSFRYSNCSWLIRAPFRQRVYLIFDYINLPGDSDSDSSECSSSYISIASLNKPKEFYKLCGQRKNVKLLTSYNNVLINFIAESIIDFAAGFSLVYKVISDPSALAPSTTATRTTVALVSKETPSNSNLNCGNPFFKPNDVVSRIIGGTISKPHSWPWQVMITDGTIMCGGALVDQNWIVTAAHCTENINKGPIKVYLGMHNRLKPEANRVVKTIAQVVIHPNYMGRLTQWDYDIAMMRLDGGSVKLNTDISPICLPSVNFATIGSTGFVTGWGDTQGTGASHILRQTTVRVADNKACGADSENMLCAGEDKPEIHDSCQGDSGGPLVFQSNGKYHLVGIVSWGYDCQGHGVYTKVSNFVNWINSVLILY